MKKFGNYGVIKVPEEILSNMVACPVDFAFKCLAQKFTILILRDLILFKKKKFSDLLKSVEGINQKTLSLRLRELEKEGFITKKIYSEKPIRAEYLITKKGEMVRPILEQMAAFSFLYFSEHIFKDKKPRTFEEIVGRSPSSL
jgi:DNA-binding HxlR family transcriptional regulator